MKLVREVVMVFAVGMIVFGFNSCKKITQDQIINGLWKVDGIYVGPNLDNYLNRLQHYTDGNNCCFYKLDFERDGVAFAYYLTYDSLNIVEPGSWYLNSGNEIYLKVGDYIDGTFEIAKPTLKHWRLTSNSNYIAGYDTINPQLDSVYTKVEMEKI